MIFCCAVKFRGARNTPCLTTSIAHISNLAKTIEIHNSPTLSGSSNAPQFKLLKQTFKYIVTLNVCIVVLIDIYIYVLLY